MLVPLSGTLPGWPAAPAPNLLWTLMLILGFPLGIGLIVTFLGKGHQLVQSARDNGLGSDRRSVESGHPQRPALERSGTDATQQRTGAGATRRDVLETGHPESSRQDL